jgi:hypothetical protein
MLRLRFRTDCAPRTKNGQPPQRTTGVASAASIHGWAAKPWEKNIAPIARMKTGRVRTSETRKRRRRSTSSGFSWSSSDTVLGSSAMPQIGQLPGPSRTISGCMGQVHWAALGAATGRDCPSRNFRAQDELQK